MRRLSTFLLLAGLLMAAAPAQAQQKIGYVDSEFMLENIPEYATIQQQVDRMAQEWQRELDELGEEVDGLFREYQARELLYTNEERQQKQEEIIRREEELERLRVQYFGPQGQLFQQQQKLMEPLQERILAAVEEVATRDGFDYVFDKSGDYLFMFAREEHDLSRDVLRELGIDLDSTTDVGR